MILTDGEALAGGIGILTIFLGTVKLAYNEHQNNDNKTAQAVNELAQKFDDFIPDTRERLAGIESSVSSAHHRINEQNEKFTSYDKRLITLEKAVGTKG